MRRLKNKSQFFMRVLFIIICAIGIYTNIIDTNQNAFMGNGTALNFYTIQSNILVFITELLLLVSMLLENQIAEKALRKFSVLKYMTTVAITITLVVFWTMLAPYMARDTLFSFSCILVHLVIPLGMIADYLLTKEEIQSRKMDVLYSLIPPICYLIFCFIRANVSEVRLTGGSRFPYWFLDIDEYGWFGNENGVGVFYWIVLLAFFVLTIGWCLRWIKQRIVFYDKGSDVNV